MSYYRYTSPGAAPSMSHDLYVCIILNSGSNNIQHKRAKTAIRRLSARKLNTCIIAMESVVQRTGTEQMGISATEAVKTTVGTVSEVLNVSYCLQTNFNIACHSNTKFTAYPCGKI